MSNRLNSWCSFSYSQSWFRSVHFKHLELGWCRQSSPGPSAFPSSSALWLNHQRVCGREREREEQILSQHTLSLPLAEPAEECECVSMDKCVCVCVPGQKKEPGTDDVLWLWGSVYRRQAAGSGFRPASLSWQKELHQLCRLTPLCDRWKHCSCVCDWAPAPRRPTRFADMHNNV